MAPLPCASVAVQVTVVVNTLIASLLRSGTVSYLYYADRVMEFPLGVFGIALATAVLPSMSSQAARGEHAALRSTLGFALRLSAFIAVPAAVVQRRQERGFGWMQDDNRPTLTLASLT